MHPTHTFRLLLRREFWEHKGGFLWAPVITGGIAALLAVLVVIAGSLLGSKARNEFDFDGDIAEFSRGIGMLGDGMLLVGIGLTGLVLAFVVFFYALGSLYDDRRDRSILFWKSMPISDTQVVLSKAAWALLLAPAISIAIGIALGMVFWVIGFFTINVNGVPGGMALLTHSHPLRIIGEAIVSLPLQMLWSLPAVGWLMMCSAWSKRVPFLWAALVPILACTIVSMLDIFPGVEIPHGKIWYTVVYRGLLSVVPGTWVPGNVGDIGDINGPAELSRLVNVDAGLSALGSADLWIGAVLGAAMIFTAIRLRRWRDEG
ncbi:ABC transporter permease [Lysobacter psychrotolerans]|uniref:ABC transporter permease n=1 Tax=Montanilutibacter psychrotolerans TaxID=1327343 RepID=A0A3M8SVY3_9GAMM|nr:ABC transporter permease [Lysobacter psychrotolerans]